MILRKLFFCFLLLVAVHAPALEWRGRCVGVSDGDTVRVLGGDGEVKIRLYGVDCPESGQEFGAKAKDFTSALVFDQLVSVQALDIDRYGRTVALVSVNGLSVNRELVAAGLAWVHSRYCRTELCADWHECERLARDNCIGLWSCRDPQPPWQFRKNNRKKLK
jgi:endonuclease YncB( thermonuclease family)